MGMIKKTWLSILQWPYWGRRDGSEYWMLYAKITNGPETGRRIEIRIRRDQLIEIFKEIRKPS